MISCGLSRTSERGSTSRYGQNGLAGPAQASAFCLSYVEQPPYLVILTSWLIRPAGRLVEVENGETRMERSWAGIAARERAQRRGRAMVAAFNGWREGGLQASGVQLER